MNSLALVGLLVATSACGREGPTSPGAPLATYSLSGTVTETTPSGLLRAHILSGVAFEVTSAGNVPVEGVDIYCDGCGEFGHTGVRTDPRGFYAFPRVYPGVQYLQVGKQGYRTVVPPSPMFLGIPVTVSGDIEFDIQLVRQ